MLITTDDRSALENISSIAPRENLIVFESRIVKADSSGKTVFGKAWFATKSMSFSVNLSFNITDNKKSPTKFALPADKLRSIVSMLPAGELNFTVEGLNAKFSTTDNKTSRQTSLMATDSVFSFDLQGDLEDCLITDPELFDECISFASRFVHKDEFLPQHAVLIETSGKSAKIFGTNGTHLGYQKYDQKNILFNTKIMIAQEHVPSISKILCADDTKVILSIDESGRYRISSKFGSIVCCPQPGDFLPFLKAIDEMCAIRTDFTFSASANRMVLDSAEFKKHITHAMNIFARNEYPFVDFMVVSGKEKLILGSHSVGNSDRFTGEMVVDSDNKQNYSVRLSPVILSKCLSALDGAKVVFAWSSTAKQICLTNHKKTRLVMMMPRLDIPQDDN